MVDETSGVIKKTLSEHNTLGDRVNSAKLLVTKFRRRDQTDKILIGFATLVFMLTCFYVVRKRF